MKLIIFGTTASGKIAHYYFSSDSEYEVVAFTVDSAYLECDELLGLPVVPFEELQSIYPSTDHHLFVAMGYTGMNQQRADKYQQAKQMGYHLATYISSRCNYLSTESPGENCFILEDNTIQPFVEIGNNVVMWSGNHIGHDAIIGDHCFISSHVVISGFTRIGPSCFLGVNSTFRDSIEVGEKTLIGAGAVIMKSTAPESVWLPPRSTKLSKKSSEVGM